MTTHTYDDKKPKFDPNKKFTPVDEKPPFDPNKPFEKKSKVGGASPIVSSGDGPVSLSDMDDIKAFVLDKPVAEVKATKQARMKLPAKITTPPLTQVTSQKPSEKSIDEEASRKIEQISDEDFTDPIKGINKLSQANPTNAKDILATQKAKDILLSRMASDGFDAKNLLNRSFFGGASDDNITSRELRSKAEDYDKSVAPLRDIEVGADLSQANDLFLDYNYKDKIYSAAVQAYAEKHPTFKKELGVTGIDSKDWVNLRNQIPNGKMGVIVSEYLSDPNVSSFLQKENPALIPAFQHVEKNLLKDNNDFAINEVANKVSKEVQKTGFNNIDPIFNYYGDTHKEFADQIARQVLSPEELAVWDKDIKNNQEQYMDAPSLMQGIAEGGKGVFKGIENTFTEPFISVSESTKRRWEKESSNVSADPQGVFKIVRDTGHVLGLVGAIAGTGNVLGGGGAGIYSSKIVPALSGGVLPFMGDMLEEGRAKYPDSPVKAWTSALFNTSMYAALSQSIFPAKKLQQAIGSVKPEINNIVERLANGSITKEAARLEANTTFKKVLDFAGGTLKTPTKITAELTAIQKLNKGFDYIMMDEKEFKEFHPEKDEAKDVLHLWLSNLALGGLTKFGEMKKRNRIAEESYYELASNPKKYERMINNLSVDKSFGTINEFKENLTRIANVKKELDGLKINPKDQKRFIFESLKENAAKEEAERTTDPTIQQRIKETIKEAKEIKEKILAGEDAEKIVTESEQKKIDEQRENEIKSERLTKDNELENKKLDAQRSGLDGRNPDDKLKIEIIEEKRKRANEDYESELSKLKPKQEQELSPEQVIIDQADKGKLAGGYSELVKQDPSLAKDVLLDYAKQKYGLGDDGSVREGGGREITNKEVDAAVTKAFPDKESVVATIKESTTPMQDPKEGATAGVVPSTLEPKEIITPEGFQNRIHEGGVVLGSPTGESHVTEQGYTYRSVGEGEIAAISETGGVFSREGKQKGGNTNVKYWSRGNGKFFYRPNQNVIRVKNENISEGKVVAAENLEIWDKSQNKFIQFKKPDTEGVVPSTLENQKADIEKRRQEELRQNLSKTDFAISLFPAFAQSNMSQGGGAYMEVNFGKNIVFRLDTYLTPSSLNKQYPSITDGTAQLYGEMSDGTKISIPWNQLKDLLNSIKAVNTKRETVYEFDTKKINAKYDAELAAIEGVVPSTSPSVIMPGEIQRPETITIKPKEDAIQEQRPDEMDVRQQAGDGETMGERDVQSEITTGKEEGKDTGKKEVGGEPPISEPTKAGGVIGEQPSTILSHRGLQEVANEFSLPDVKSRDKKTDIQLRQDARETVDGWAERGEYRRNVEGLVEKAEKGEILTDEQRVILEGHLANVRQELREMDVTSHGYDVKLAEVRRLKDAGEITRSEAGAALRIPTGRGSEPKDIVDAMVEEMDITKTDILTDKQKETVQREFKEETDASEKWESKRAKLAEDRDNREAQKNVDKIAKGKQSKSKAPKDHTEIRKKLRDQLKAAREEHDKWLKDQGIQKSGFGSLTGKEAKIIFEIAKDYVEEGAVKLADAVKKTFDDVKGIIPDISERDVRDVIAGKYAETKTRSDLAISLQNIRTEQKLIDELEKLEAGVEPKKEKRKIKRNQRITELRKRIKEHDLTKLAESKKRMQQQIEKIQEQIKKGDFAPPSKPEPLKMDAEAIRLKDRLIKIRNEKKLRQLRQFYENQSDWEKGVRLAIEIANIPRALMATLDFSALLRQAVIPTIARPRTALRISGGRFEGSVAEMFRGAGSQRYYDRWFADLAESKRFEDMKKSALAITDSTDPNLQAREEAWMSGLADKIPGVGPTLIKGSERAYSMGLNKIRVDLYNRFADAMEQRGLTVENSPEAYKQMAAYINNSTGRGDLGSFLNKAAPVLNALFFSPRLIASRVNMLTYLLQPRFYRTVPKEVRKAYFMDMAKFIGLGITVLALAKLNGAEVEDDPRSSDFGKIKVGNTRWDIWGGFQQYARVGTQMITGERKSTTGRISQLDGEGPFGTSRGDVLTSFGRGKLSPTVSMGVDILAGRNIIGEKLTTDWSADEDKEIGLGGYLGQHFLPLNATGLYEALQDQGVKAWFTVGIPSTFGVGVQTYESKKPTTDQKQSKQQKGTDRKPTKSD